jgi:hypothetical protein
MLTVAYNNLIKRKWACVMEPLHTVVQQGRADKFLTPIALLASRFYQARTVLCPINVVLNATSKALNRPLSFDPLERSIMRRLQKVPHMKPPGG